MKSPKLARSPVGDLGPVACRACGQARDISWFRLFRTKPTPLYMDFCVDCEKANGTLVLYRRFNAYGTAEIIDAVFTADRVPRARRTDEQVRLIVEPATHKPPETNEQLVVRELQRRELSRRRLVYFVTTFHPSYKPGWMHQDICRRLERFVLQIEAGLSPRLMLALPPRAGKSLLASDLFPSWVLGKHPEWGIIASSYAQSLPLEFSRNIRDRLRDPEYQNIFEGTKIRQDAQGIEQWKTTAGGGYLAAGVGTGITGKGFNLGICDDLLKDAEAADSDTIRDSTYTWFQRVFRTRAAPGAGIIAIGTRWHHDDPQGRLIDRDEELRKAGVPEGERENWELVSYPAIAEHSEYLMQDGTIQQDVADEADVLRLLRAKGAALHPERYPLSELLKIKNLLTSSAWNALYQQAPTPDAGDFFKRDDFVYRWLDPEYRVFCRIFMTVDYAISKKTRRDWTVMGVYALSADDDLYCLELRRGRWGTDDIVRNASAMIERHKPEIYAGERGQIHEAVWPVLDKELQSKRLFVSVDESLVPIQDKEARARPLQGRMQRRKFIFSYDGETRPDVYDTTEREFLQFPNGTNDDTVDCNAWAARLALNISLPRAETPVKKIKSWKDGLAVNTAPKTHMVA